MKEFNLSERINKFIGWHSKENRFIHINHVKEFTQVIMQQISFVMNNSDYTEDDILDVIEKYAGKECVFVEDHEDSPDGSGETNVSYKEPSGVKLENSEPKLNKEGK